jgi:hypothetical protein
LALIHNRTSSRSMLYTLIVSDAAALKGKRHA